MIPSAEEQLQFFHKIQLLLEEGSFSSTYKYALLLAIADLSVEKGEELNSSLRLSVDSIARKFIFYYWRQSIPYPSINEEGVLFQNNGKQAGVIKIITNYQLENNRPLHQAIHDPVLINSVAKVVRTMPLWRLQKMPSGIVDFIYEQTTSGSEIVLREGVAYCFRVFHGHIQNMVQGAWLRWVRKLKHNHSLLGQLKDLNEFMFGSERANLGNYVPMLIELQSNTCFYCDKSLKGNKSEVDHFLPWSRYPVDLGHNFVLAHSVCNRDKNDLLPAVTHLENWINRNDSNQSQMDQYFCENNLLHDIDTSVSITKWAYDKTELLGGDVWLSKKNQTCKLDDSWRILFSK